MGDVNLAEDQCKTLGQLLSSAVKNKESLTPNDSDAQRASVLIFSLIQKGYNFWERDLENIIELSGDHYSKPVQKYLKEIIWVCNELDKGLINDYENERFKLKDFI